MIGPARPLPVVLLVLATLSGCCSVQMNAAGFRRQCVANPLGPNLFAVARIGPQARHVSETRQRPAVRWAQRLGVYSLIEPQCHWVRLGTYYRLQGREWQAAPWIEGPWSDISESELPGTLFEFTGECEPEPQPRATATAGTPDHHR